MSDWSVVVWFGTDSLGTRRTPYQRRHAQDVHTVGPSGPRERIEALGHALVDFLRGAGFALDEAEGGAKFVRRSGNVTDG